MISSGHFWLRAAASCSSLNAISNPAFSVPLCTCILQAFGSGTSALLLGIENGACSGTATVFNGPLKPQELEDLRTVLRTDLVQHGSMDSIQSHLLLLLQVGITHLFHHVVVGSSW